MIDGRRPFTEMFEVVQKELVREAASGEDAKYKNLINDIYINELPSLLPEKYIKKKAYVTTVSEYTVGTVTVGTGTANVIGVATSWDSTQSDRWLKVEGSDELLRITFAATTSLTFNAGLTWVGDSGTGLSYTMFQDRYQLASDFGYMIKDAPDNANVVSRQINGVKVFMEPLNNEEFDRRFTTNIGSVYAYTVRWENELPYLHVLSNPDLILNLEYDYIPQFNEMIEYATGTVTFTTGTAVVGSGTLFSSALNSANTMYIRNDADGTGSNSLWFKISSITDDTNITISKVFTGTSGASISFTIAEVSKWPARMDSAIIYKAAYIADPDGVQGEKWLGLANSAIALDLTVESKRKRGHQFKHFPGKR